MASTSHALVGNPLLGFAETTYDADKSCNGITHFFDIMCRAGASHGLYKSQNTIFLASVCPLEAFYILHGHVLIRNPTLWSTSTLATVCPIEASYGSLYKPGAIRLTIFLASVCLVGAF